MKLNFCTLFDSNYLTRGLAMHDSLLKNCTSFHLYIFAFDTKAAGILQALKLPHTTVVTLAEFEDPQLLQVKPDRTIAEYCWTCTPSTILYCIEKFSLENCTYIDADLLFYSDPLVLFNELGKNSVLITEHRYTPEYDQTKLSGKYCVQFITFKNDERGMKVLRWWRNACLEWCYCRYEDGKFGDQKYLDDWTTRFEGVHELQHIGGGVAPWNLQQYSFRQLDGRPQLKQDGKGSYANLVFFHFHDLKFYLNDIVKLSVSYYLPRKVINLVYFPYIRKLMSFKKKLSAIDAAINANAARGNFPGKPYTWRDKVHIYKKNLLSFNMEKIKAGHKEIAQRYCFYTNTFN